MPALMFQGTGSNVGKSLLVAGLCRALHNRGVSVAPFKPQNMSNNAAVTADGGEIGRAQALQALASGLAAHTDMNPVLLKPETETGAQLVVQGRRVTSLRAHEYSSYKPGLMPSVLESFQRLRARHELVLVEGAGSPAEINLRSGDIANMGFAVAADVPVVLVGDIDRGGVIAQIIGTQAVLSQTDRKQIAGFIINKFRGDTRLFKGGYADIASRTGWPGYGVVPWFDNAWQLPAEDALDISAVERSGGLHIACLKLSRIANFDDLDPLGQEPDVRLTLVEPGTALPGDVDLVIIPGSKSTRGDLAFLRAQGWDVDIRAHIRRGGYVLGICGGYQMLGQRIDDPDGIEGPAGESIGLGQLDVRTTMTRQKRLTTTDAVHVASGVPFEGYEMHIGRTSGPDTAQAFARIGARAEGAVSPSGRVMGSYLHGMFRETAFRAAFLAALGGQSAQISYSKTVETALDALAAHIETHLDVDGLRAAAR